MEQGKKTKIKKILSVSLNVFMYIFLALCIFLLVVSVTSKKDSDGAVNIFGGQMRIVVSDSMAKCDETYDTIKQYKIKDIPLRSMVFIECVPENETEANAWYSKLKKGDVLTFKYSYGMQVTITHRIVEIAPNDNGGYTIVLEGDNRAPKTDDGIKTTVSQQIIHTEQRDSSPNFVVGKVTGQSKLLGLLVYAVKQPVGIALIVIVPCLIIMVMEIVRIVSVLGEEKRRKAAEVQERQSNEIEELRRQLASLQAGLAGSPAQPNAQADNVAQTSENTTEQPDSVHPVAESLAQTDTNVVAEEVAPQPETEAQTQEQPSQEQNSAVVENTAPVEQSEQVESDNKEDKPKDVTE